MIDKFFNDKALYIVKSISKYFQFTAGESKIYEFYIAGGCFGDKITDIDIFPKSSLELKADVVAKTPNATTYNTEPWPIQVCNFYHPTLESLIGSFDFTHTQIGAEVNISYNGVSPIPLITVKKVYYTKYFIDSSVTGKSTYVGSKFPLSSLIRCGKYYNKGILNRHTYIASVLQCVTDVIKRGFKDYNDFKDQLDAVDLGLLPEELAEIEKVELMKLFDLLKKDK